MTGYREPWYLDRLRAELERVAEIEDRRESRGVVGRLRVPRRPLVAVVAALAVFALLVVAVRVLERGEHERSAAPPPPPTATPAPEQGAAAILRRLDGVYVAEITSADLDKLDVPRRPPAGVWKFAIHANDRTLEVSEPENTGLGGYVLDITGVERGRLTFGPDRTCELRAGRTSQSVANFSLVGSMLTFTRVQGGCVPGWAVLMSTQWRKA
jgi:hypothetical protein